MNHGPTPLLASPQKSSRPDVAEKKGWLARFIDRLLGRRPAPTEHLASQSRPQNPRQASRSERTDKSSAGRPDKRTRGRDRSERSRSSDANAAPYRHHNVTPFRMISTTAELEEAVLLFAPHERIALDTEADSLHCYFDKLCLLQISIPGNNFLIDPLGDISLEPLFAALEGKVVVIHSADYDLRLLRRCGYHGPTVLFDTMIGARLCGATEFGLASLLHQHFGLTVAKASQKANWARRPLPPEMIEYAVNDTLNLLTLAEIQEKRLRELGRWEWFEQMCEKQIRSSSVTRERDPDTLWRLSGYADLSKRGAAVLRALWHWRDQEAQAADKPSFHILNNDQLLHFSDAFDKGQSPDPRHLRGGRWTRLLEAAEGAMALPEEEWPKAIRKPRLRTTPEQDSRFRELRKFRDAEAEKLQLDPTLIAAKGTLEQLSRGEEQAFEALLPWQRKCLGLDDAVRS